MKQIAASKASNKASFTLDPPYHWPNRSCYHWVNLPNDRTEDDETNAICWIGAIKFSVQQNEGTERKGRRVKQRMAVQWTAGQWERRSTYLTWLPLALNAKQWSGMQGIMEQNSLRQILIHTSHYPRWIFTVFFNIVIIGLFQKSNQ